MATVSYSTTANFGAMTALAVSKVQEARAALQRVKDNMLAIAGAPFDPSKIEGGDFGVASGKGQAFYDAVSGLLAEINSSNAQIFSSQIDKGA